MLTPASSAEPAVRAYVCPWLKMPGGIPEKEFQILQIYPHDPQAYTQGLVYQDDLLYESTGLVGASSLRKVELETGKVLQRRDIPEPYFGEGIALFEGKIFQLTWQTHEGFVFDQQTFDQLSTFGYQTEGWGLTQDGHNLIMSDGSDRLTFLDPESLQSTRSVSVTAGASPVTQLNELEYIHGEIWANIYQTSCIARINPQDGSVLGWMDVGGLLSREEMLSAEVPNGIAYDSETGRIFLTGKYWPKLYLVEEVPVEAN